MTHLNDILAHISPEGRVRVLADERDLEGIADSYISQAIRTATKMGEHGLAIEIALHADRKKDAVKGLLRRKKEGDMESAASLAREAGFTLWSKFLYFRLMRKETDPRKKANFAHRAGLVNTAVKYHLQGYDYHSASWLLRDEGRHEEAVNLLERHRSFLAAANIAEEAHMYRRALALYELAEAPHADIQRVRQKIAPGTLWALHGELE